MSKHELRAIVTAILVGSGDFYEYGEGAQMVADDLIERAREPRWRVRVWRRVGAVELQTVANAVIFFGLVAIVALVVTCEGVW